MSLATVLIVPGLRDHVESHWQTLLAARLEAAGQPVRTVPAMGRADLSCAARVEAIERAVADIDGEPILVAHSGGCIMVAHWAQQSRRPVQGVLMATPPDFEEAMPPGFPTLDELDQAGWLPVPRGPLPFPSIAAVSSNDPLGRLARVEQLALGWGSHVVPLGEVGHLNPASGYGEWRLAEGLIAALRVA
ncbi:MAG TPA: alpha/beta fold hydrolase [Pseudoduganella sp.]